MPGRRMITMLSIVLLAVLMLASYKAFWVYQQLQLLHAPKPPVSVAVANANAVSEWRTREAAR